MKRSINLKGQDISYKLNTSKRAKSISIASHYNGDIVVTIPVWAKEELAEDFLKRKADWLFKSLNNFEKMSDKIFLKSDKKSYKKHKEEARELITKRVEYNNKSYNFKFNKIFIRNQKRQWGSCSELRNLNFNFKLIFLPLHLLDYIVVHELCHLKEMNHSKDFWRLVEKSTPNHKDLRRELKRYI